MLSALLASAGPPLSPAQLWSAWNLDPVLLAGLGGTAALYTRGRHLGARAAFDRWRAWCFAGALVAIGGALVSPLDALSGALASAHMVQHVILVLVAAPLLALARPVATLRRSVPRPLRRAGARWHRRLGLGRRRRPAWRDPVVVWLAHVAVLWAWHAAVLYQAAVDHQLLHIGEHASFLVTGVLFWSVVAGARRISDGYAALLVFTMALQSVFLSALLTFARSPWYPVYADTAGAWGLDPLADQQLAGAIMWVPAGFVYLGAALALMVAWVRASELGDATA
ncbi:MAG TPA: cytochrome c oxidase assembly protein [Acidimicrobiales bacterium]|nr:cytochrome c oxidase assembly protein [Acidimicrobiales bacterium]